MLSSKQWNNKSSDIKLVYLYSTIKMMHGPINIRVTYVNTYSQTQLYLVLILQEFTTTCFGPKYMGHHQVVLGLTAQAILACVWWSRGLKWGGGRFRNLIISRGTMVQPDTTGTIVPCDIVRSRTRSTTSQHHYTHGSVAWAESLTTTWWYPTYRAETYRKLLYN